jgi:CheY-like chemotaxis protein
MTQPILIVEDDAIARAGLAAILQANGYATLTAASGQAALAQLRSTSRPALILLDMILSGSNGWQFIAELRKDATLAGIPVVILTGMTIASDEWARSLGAVGLLRKPIDVPMLLDTVRRHVGAG